MEYFRKIRDYVLGEVMHCCEGIANGRREADVLHHWSVVAILVRCNIAKVSRAGLVIRSRQPTDKQTLETLQQVGIRIPGSRQTSRQQHSGSHQQGKAPPQEARLWHQPRRYREDQASYGT